MSERAAPTRWRDGPDPDLAEAVSTHLERAAGQLPSSELRARMRAELLARSAGQAVLPAGRGAGPRRLTLVIGGAALLGAVVLGLAHLMGRSAPSAPEAPHAALAAPAPQLAPRPPEAAPARPLPAEVPSSAPQLRAQVQAEQVRPEESRPPGRRARIPPRPTPPSHAVAPDELMLLRAARRLLATDPRASLTLIDEHGVRYARGNFAEERELLRIQALLALGDVQSGRARAQAFRAAHPASVHLPRIDRLIGDHAP